LDVLRDSASAFSSFLLEYAAFVLLTIVLVCLIYRAQRKPVTGVAPPGITLAITMVLLALAVNFGRPLTPKNASYHVHPANVALVTNTPLTLGYSLLKGQQVLEEKHYFGSPEERRALFGIHHDFQSDSLFRKKNVVIFVLESFSREYLLEEHINRAPAPFIDSLLNSSTVFTNAFANGTTSAYALMSILGGIPPFLDEPYFASIYGDNRIKGIGTLLKEKGYSCHFFYGAEEDHYGFRKNMSLLGIDQYHSMEDYRRATGDAAFRNDYDGHWGIYDGPFFQYAADELRRTSGPFFATIFNISTHFPYRVPRELADSLDEGRLVSHQSIAYTDRALREFFRSVRQEEWFDETLFVFIADHWAKLREIEDKSAVGIYRIPFFLYDPADRVRRDIDAVAQQVDVVPLLLDLLDYSGPWMSFGRSPLSDTAYRFTFNEFENVYRIMDSSFVLAYDENREEAFSIHNYRDDPGLINDRMGWIEEKEAFMEAHLKAVIQAYNNHLVRNDVWVEPRVQ
jgi:phosphoglycerol transferase MdoB-like AlkP superfamily enzyme